MNDIMEQNIVDAVDGKTVVSTIDVNIQSIVEKYISAFNEKLRNNAYEGDGAENIGVIVENPNNGEILAMAGKNTFDLMTREPPMRTGRTYPMRRLVPD